MTSRFSQGRSTIAAVVVLLLGTVLGGVSVVGPAAPAGASTAIPTTTSITGVVTLPSGSQPGWLNGVQVYAEVDGQFATAGTVNPQTGSYTISGLAPGSYVVEFQTDEYTDSNQQQVSPNLADEFYGGVGYFAAATQVSTSVSSPATGIDITLQLGATISGNANTPAGDAAQGFDVYYVNAADPEHELIDGDTTDDSGDYSVTGLFPGSYKVLLVSGNDFQDGDSAVSNAYVGGASYAAASTITVATGSTVTAPTAVVPAASTSVAQPAAPAVTVASSSSTSMSLNWTAPASSDPILMYEISVAPQLELNSYFYLDAATTSNNQDIFPTSGGSTLAFVSALTGSADGAVAPLVLNQSSDPAAPVVSAVDSGQDGLTVSVSGSAPSDAALWIAYLPLGGGEADVQFANPDPGSTSSTFTGLSRSAGDIVYAGWGIDPENLGYTQSQIATLTLGPPVNAWFQAKYQQLGGASGSLGAPTAAMVCQSSACWQQFAGGVLTSDGSEIVELSTAYVSTWLADGGPDGELGLVAGPESCFGTYCVTPFTHGVVTWTPNVGVSATVVNAWFEATWKQLGGVTGSLGSPTAAMQCQSSSCWQQFTGGVLTSDGHEIVKLSSAYVSTWLAWGGPNGDLGLVAGSEACYGTYCQTPFAGGVIVWVPNSGVYPVAKNWFLPAWTAHGGASGSLGLPTAAMQCQSAACYQVFQNGTLTSSTTGIVALSSAYVSTWLADGGPNGTLGLVAGPEQCFSTYCRVPFQHGTLVWQPGVGVHLAS